MTRVYVAGSSSELERVEGVIAALREAGCEVTFDWTADIRAARAAGHTDATISDEWAWHASTADLDGVGNADVVLWLMPASKSEGAAYEVGFADALSQPIMVAGPDGQRSIFARRHRIVEDDRDAVALIAGGDW